MKYILIFIGIFFPILVHSSLPIQVSLEELVKNSDHLLVGHVVGVDMVNDQGIEITDLNSETGPGSKNLIRLIVRIDETLISSIEDGPTILKVPLDPFMHFSLGQIKKTHNGEGERELFLLKGSDFQPPFAGVFRRDISEKEQIIQLMKSNKVKNLDSLRELGRAENARPF